MFQQRDSFFPPGRQMFTTPVARPFIRQPQGTFNSPDFLGRQTPGVLGVPDPQLLPQNTTNQSLDSEFEEVRRRLDRPSPGNDDREPFLGFQELRRRLEIKSPGNDNSGNEHQYEEIREKDDNVEQATPQSWPTPAFPVRNASAPPSWSPGNLPQPPGSNTMDGPIITIEEDAPGQAPLTDRDWQEGDELGAVGGLRRSEQLQHDDSWETEHNADGLEWDNTTFDWEWNPIKRSPMEEQRELQRLIDYEVQIVHQLEKKIGKSPTLEAIFDNENIKCSLLYDENIAKATLDPNVLHDDQKERLKMMREIYEEVKLKKDKTMQALENVTDIGAIRKSKRLSSKPRRKYKK